MKKGVSRYFNAFSKENFPGGGVGGLFGSFPWEADGGKAPEEAVSRVPCAARRLCRVAAISLRRALPRALSGLDPRASGGQPLSPGRKEPPGEMPSYLVLLRVGFAVPRRSPAAR